MNLQPPLTLLHGLFTRRIAGSERYCIDLANRQAQAGHRVHVAGLPRSQIAAELHPSVQFHALATPWLRGRRLARLAGQIGARLYHGHLSAACKLGAALPEGIARVATLHVGYKPHQHGHLDGLICVNQAQAGLLDDYAGLARSIPNWLPASSTRASQAATLREELGLDDEQLLVVAVGRLHPSKGMDLLVQAFREAAPPDAVLLIAGEGPQQRALRRLSEGDDRVRLLGFRADVARLLDAADLFVSPSREESFGLAILEAMHCGLPVIATATQGPSELLAGQPAKLVPCGDVHALSAALALALRGLRGAGRPRLDYQLARFAPARSLQAMQDFYLDVIARAEQGRSTRAALRELAHA